MTETEAAAVARVQAEIARISQLPVLDLDERADSFATGVRWTLRLIHDALTGTTTTAPAGCGVAEGDERD